MDLGLSVDKLSNPNTTVHFDALPRRPGAGAGAGKVRTEVSWVDSKGLSCRF